tara:strand:- start:1284 stop:2045 length:762 start_codon:yes stop_codon:yes gene_type:complete
MNLGRNKDPKTTDDIGFIKLIYKKTFWSTLSILGPRTVSRLVYPNSISFMKSDNAVALTIDDAFCGLDNPNGSMVEDVRILLDKYNANATFFVHGSHLKHTDNYDVESLLIDGHELANHNMYDMPYNKLTIEDFENDLIQTKNILLNYTDDISPWYRAPHAKISKQMHKVLKKHNLTHVLGDVFANDTSIPDPKWIAKYSLNKVKPGSIIIIHMPEKGVRQWNYDALEIILEGLNNKGYDIVTLTELSNPKSN